MRVRPPAFLVFAMAAGFAACQDGTQFKGTGKLGGSIDASRAKVTFDPGGLNNAVTGGDPTSMTPGAAFTLPCESAGALVASTSAKTLLVPVVCGKEETIPGQAFTDMDLVFVLDTTGSMQPYVQMVRDNIQEIAQSAQRNGYTVRFGAISFGDEIYDTQLLTENAEALVAAMADTNPKWKPTDARGGLAPEQGLGAIESGITLLQSGQSHSKTLVYFSDGPAMLRTSDRMSLESSFSVAHTAQALAAFTRKVQEQSGMFRFITGTSCARGDSWYLEWPTPCLQISGLAQSSGVRHLPLTFPMTNVGYDEEFLAKVETKPTQVVIDCTLTSIAIQSSSGQMLLPESQVAAAAGAAGGLWSAPVDFVIPAGTYSAIVKRSCKGKISESNFSLEVK